MNGLNIPGGFSMSTGLSTYKAKFKVIVPILTQFLFSKRNTLKLLNYLQ